MISYSLSLLTVVPVYSSQPLPHVLVRITNNAPGKFNCPPVVHYTSHSRPAEICTQTNLNIGAMPSIPPSGTRSNYSRCSSLSGPASIELHEDSPRIPGPEVINIFLAQDSQVSTT
ncbi:hypothetical protein F5Y07DRAFT_242182 [Xylaria sp. FL0933]|nr:hypothetical protein F5Y07DRAFT_242182 [Xylaria sp. FL0933]